MKAALKDPIVNLENMLVANRRVYLAYICKRVGNLAEIEDVLQDFRLRALSHRNQLNDPQKQKAWLFAILRSTINDYYRKTGRAKRLNVAFAREMQSTKMIEDSCEERKAYCQCARELVSGLSPVEAELVRLVDIEEVDRTAIAAELGIEPATLNVRLHRARSALSKNLLSHCGPCCREGFDDCYCTPAGCDSTATNSKCKDAKSPQSLAR